MERWGKIITIRPEVNAYFRSGMPFEEWDKLAHLEFILKKGGLNAKGKALVSKIENFSNSVIPMYDEYQSILESKGKIEFQDMLNDAVYALESNLALRQTIQERYQYIMVDEFQDCNKMMVALDGTEV
mgnify:FL=1